MTVRTRIAPSPTGYMHVGTLRTALYDYFLARQNGGQFIIRVEDTDQARLVPGVMERLLQTFQDMGIDYDEGPILNTDGSVSEKGDVGPYIQSKRLEIYRPFAEQLRAAGHAYVCFCTRERLEEMRAAQMATKQTPKYDRRCLSLSPEEIQTRLAAGEAHVLRMKIPEGTVSFEDGIRGRIEFNLSDVDDQVIMKSDGFASYHLAVVVDDHLMAISHVLRGEEWISSTPKQIVLHEMLGWKMPVYAHVPLILNPDKSKLSKRQGDVAVEDYLAKGYLPEALSNFVSLIGFNPKADQEIYAREELVHLFDLAKVNKSGGVFDHAKLDWVNGEYIRKMTLPELCGAIRPFLGEEGVLISEDALTRICAAEQARLVRLTDLKEHLSMYVGEPAVDPAILIWKKADAADAKVHLTGMADHLEGESKEVFDSLAMVETAMKRYIERTGASNGNVLWPTRVALSGRQASPSPFELAFALGQEATVQRLRRAASSLS